MLLSGWRYDVADGMGHGEPVKEFSLQKDLVFTDQLQFWWNWDLFHGPPQVMGTVLRGEQPAQAWQEWRDFSQGSK